jgi:glycosyltransferase involved in cell wall biosynthesis
LDRIKTACSPLRPGIYPGVDLYHSRRVASWLRDRASHCRYDLAVIETISMASYLADLRRAAHRVVFDAHNIESTLHAALVAADSRRAPALGRIKTSVLNRRMWAAERRVVRGADLVWVCSRGDARQLESVYGRRAGITVVPNGVDVDAYRRAGAVPSGGDWASGPITMVYPGLLDYGPNEVAAFRLIDEVLPAIRARGYQARVVLVGRNPKPALIEAARRHPGIEVTGAVYDIVRYLEPACVVTLPITVGSGTRVKILEAFAASRPVVSTSKGAEGIDAIDGDHLLIRESSTAMADAVIEVWRAPSLRGRLCHNALELVQARYSWSAAAAQIAHSLGVRGERVQ